MIDVGINDVSERGEQGESLPTFADLVNVYRAENGGVDPSYREIREWVVWLQSVTAETDPGYLDDFHNTM